MVDHVIILQVVGFKNSGKTSLIEKMSAACRDKKLRVGVVKHHGHGLLDEHDETKDTGKFRASGAEVTAITAGGGLEMIWDREREWELEEILAFYRFLELDVLFVEGFKHADLQKIIMVRDADDFKELKSLSNIAAVISWTPLDPIDGLPLFHISEVEHYLTWALSRLGVELGES